MESTHKLSLENAQRFVLGGKAVFTVRNSKTLVRFTFKVDKSEDGKIFFVKAMTGPDNESSYRYIGFVKADAKWKYVHGRKSTIGADAPSVKYIEWLMVHLYGPSPNLMSAEVWHEGRCCCCGRRLTDPESIESGIGPICASRH